VVGHIAARVCGEVIVEHVVSVGVVDGVLVEEGRKPFRWREADDPSPDRMADGSWALAVLEDAW
jgi:hypothetical protein